MTSSQPRYSKEEFARRGDEIYYGATVLWDGAPRRVAVDAADIDPLVRLPSGRDLATVDCTHVRLSDVKTGERLRHVALGYGRLPMEDHNTRIIVFGRDGAQAKPLRKQSLGKPSITCPTLLDHLRGCGLRQSVSPSSSTPAVR